MATAAGAPAAEADVGAPGELLVDVPLGGHMEGHRMDRGGELLVAQLEVGCGGRETCDLSAVPVFDEVFLGPKLHGEVRECRLAPPQRCSDGLAVADGGWGPETEGDEAWKAGELLNCATGAVPPPSRGRGGGEGAAPWVHAASVRCEGRNLQVSVCQ